MFLRFGIFLLLALTQVGSVAQTTANERQARQMFNQVYDMVFGPQGSTLRYSVNIVGIFKTEGTIWYKGKKSRFTDEKYDAYSDGTTYWRVERKKKTVTIFDMNDEARDKYATKFKFSPDDFHYSIQRDDKCYYLLLKAKKGTKGIREARVTLDLRTRHPQSVRVKVGIFHATIRISGFRSGGISDKLFAFDKQKYAGYKVIDKR